MFSFLDDFGNYEERKVDRFENDDLSISTCRVSDSKRPFETAVKHPKYRQDKWIVVEKYDTKEQAQTGHDKWVETMTTDPLPAKLIDVSDNEIRDMSDSLGLEWEEEFEYGS
jgi:hypothetical protein